MVAALLCPLHDRLRRAADDVGGPEGADTVVLTRHNQVVLLAGQMRVLIRRAGAVTEDATAGLYLYFAFGARPGLKGAVGYDVTLTEDSLIPVVLVRA